MITRLRSHLAHNVVGYVALVLAMTAAGGVAYSAIPDSQGVIHGCYDNATGALRVTDAEGRAPLPCTGRETALDWNQQGPPGPAPPASMQPADEPPPPPAFTTRTPPLKGKDRRKTVKLATKGQDDGAYATWRDDPVAIPEGAGLLTVAHLDVPAGKYVTIAKMRVQQWSVHVSCRLQAGTDYDTAYRAFSQPDDSWARRLSGELTLTVVHAFAAPGRVELRCYQSGGYDGAPNSTLHNTKITALQFDELTNKPF